MRTAVSICICSVILISLICGCTDSGESEAEADPQDMVLDHLFNLNSGNYSEAISMLITSGGEWVVDTGIDTGEIEDFLIDAYGPTGEEIVLHGLSIINEDIVNITDEKSYVKYHFDIEIRVPLSYMWGEDQGIISIEVAHFSDPDRWGILADIDDVQESLAVIPLRPVEGDMEITVIPERSEYAVGVDSIPIEIEIENVCGHPLIVEYPMRLGLGHYIEASNGSGIRMEMDYCDRDIDYMIFETGGSWTYDFDIGAVNHAYEFSGGPFSWDVPDEYDVVFTHHSYGLGSVVFESEEITIEITDDGTGV